VIEYQPIPCVQHERLEFSVLRKIPLQIEYRHGLENISQAVMPLDVATRQGAEWLKFKVIGTEDVTEIRLDSIISFVEQLPA
jgi:Rho-binding antiterminator